MRNKFHPVRELLDSLTWDGKEHIRSLLPEYLGAEDSDYTYQVMRLCSGILASDFSAKAVHRGTAAADGRTTEAE